MNDGDHGARLRRGRLSRPSIRSPRARMPYSAGALEYEMDPQVVVIQRGQHQNWVACIDGKVRHDMIKIVVKHSDRACRPVVLYWPHVVDDRPFAAIKSRMPALMNEEPARLRVGDLYRSHAPYFEHLY
jgi:hypothetical protein